MGPSRLGAALSLVVHSRIWGGAGALLRGRIAVAAVQYRACFDARDRDSWVKHSDKRSAFSVLGSGADCGLRADEKRVLSVDVPLDYRQRDGTCFEVD